MVEIEQVNIKALNQTSTVDRQKKVQVDKIHNGIPKNDRQFSEMDNLVDAV